MPKKKASNSEPPAQNSLCFEEALKELEEIVSQMEGDRVPLDELLKKYERGTSLLRLCQGHIAEARGRIELISQRAENGVMALEPFDPESAESTKTASGGIPITNNPTRDDEIQLL